MLSGPNTSWQIDGENVGTVSAFVFFCSIFNTVTAAMKLKDACSFEK